MTAKGLMTLFLLATIGVLSACDDQKSANKNAKAQKHVPAVIVAPVVSKPVSASAEYIGQAQAFHSVDLRARVTGFLLERSFKEGSDVNKGDTLFVIDPSEFNAVRDASAAGVEGAKATLVEANKQLVRYTELVSDGTISVASLDDAKAAAGKAVADLAAAEADLKRVQLDVEYTKIISPINGRIGGSAVDVGNLIGPSSDILATVVALDPIHVNFTVSEREYLNYKQASLQGEAVDFTPKIRLANDSIYPHDGKLGFIDNRVDPATGTIKIRVEFPNPDGLILPGQFLNVTLVSAKPEQQVVVPQASVQANQAGPFVLVVGSDKVVEVRPVKTGRLVGPGIAITEGLKVGETIIVEGIQKVRSGATVNPVMQKAAQ